MNLPSDRAGEPGGVHQSEQAQRESEAPGSSELETACVVLAMFPNSRAAERMVWLLGGGFRRKARRGDAAAFVVTGDRHGSFSVAQSRVMTRSGLAAAAIGMSVAILAGFRGLISALKGAKTVTGAVRAQKRRVGGSAELVRELLGKAGERGAGLVVRCSDQTTVEAVEARAAERASDYWIGSRAEFLVALDRLGSEYDWLRPAAGESAHKGR